MKIKKTVIVEKNRKELICVLLPFFISVNIALVLFIVEIKIKEIFGNAPLPAFPETLFATPFYFWIIFGIVFSHIRKVISDCPDNQTMKLLWWAFVIFAPIIVSMGLFLPFSHDLSHYFTGSCNWQW